MKHQAQVTKEYNDNVASIRKMLKRLNETPYEKHFLVDHAQPDWADLGDIRRIEIKVKELSDLVFQEGEYAND
jgi:hypothetical protein